MVLNILSSLSPLKVKSASIPVHDNLDLSTVVGYGYITCLRPGVPKVGFCINYYLNK